MSKISHTIRFTKRDKAQIVDLGKLKNRGFQAQVEHMLKEQLKHQGVVMFLDRARCALEALPESERKVRMAKIANILDLEI